ncbi:MAG: hypothetical protein ACJAUZ_002868 [Flavobacteriaceae bacterium]|jgi:hypothetical protein
MKHEALQDIAVGKLQVAEQKPAWFKVSRHQEIRYLYSSDFVLKRLKWAASNSNPNIRHTRREPDLRIRQYRDHAASPRANS